MKNNMPLEMEQLEKINAFECLFECSKDHLKDVAITYSVDLNANSKIKPIKRNITYLELIRNIINTYKTLVDNGIKPGDVITYSSITTPELIYMMYACNILGCIFKPIDVRYNSEEIVSQFKETPSKLFICSLPFIDRVTPIMGDIGVDKIIVTDYKESLPWIMKKASDLKGKEILPKGLISWDEFISKDESFDIPTKQANKKEIIHISSTTGSTGKPKMLTHNSENWNAQLYNASNCGLDFKRGETFLNVTVPWVDFGIINAIHTYLCNGIRMDLDPMWTPEKNAAYIVKNDPNRWMGAPGWLDELFTSQKYQNSKIPHARFFITGGAPLFPHKHELYQLRLNEMGSNGLIVPGYGFSEASAGLSTDTQFKPGTIGRMWPLVDAEVRNPSTFMKVRQYEPGELWVCSKNPELSQISPGYYNNPKQNSQVFVYMDGKRYVRSGDKVQENLDGTFTFISRYKNILTYNGYNIDCDKITNLVSEIEEVNVCAVVGGVTNDGNQLPIICIELKEWCPETEQIVKSKINEIFKTLPEYYIPLDIVFFEEIPKTAMKIDYQGIKQRILKPNGEYKKEK